jgi:pSer/pThr/pTyr-binding forkhead associated (FHA) protein
MHQISIIYPEECQQTVQIPEAGLLIGRGFLCGLQLTDEFISTKHCRISFEDGNFYVEDLSSTNGTFIDGTEVKEKRVLLPGQSVQIGVAVLKIKE